MSQERTAELQRAKADAEAVSDIARGAASTAQRAAERAQADAATQESKAAALDAELKRTSESLQKERRTVTTKVRGDARFWRHTMERVIGHAGSHRAY